MWYRRDVRSFAEILAQRWDGTRDAAEDGKDEVALQGPRHSRASPGPSNIVLPSALSSELIHYLHVAFTLEWPVFAGKKANQHVAYHI